jgi:hypothetical protein
MGRGIHHAVNEGQVQLRSNRGEKDNVKWSKITQNYQLMSAVMKVNEEKCGRNKWIGDREETSQKDIRRALIYV